MREQLRAMSASASLRASMASGRPNDAYTIATLILCVVALVAGHPWLIGVVAAVWVIVAWMRRFEPPKEHLRTRIRSGPKRVILRPPTRDDSDEMIRIARQPHNVDRQGYVTVDQALDGARYFAAALTSYLVLDAATSRILGILSVSPDLENRRTTIGVVMDAEASGQGFTTESLGALIGAWQATPRESGWSLVLETAEDNGPMRRVMERLGYAADDATFDHTLPDGRIVEAVRYCLESPVPKMYRPQIAHEGRTRWLDRGRLRR